MKKIKNLLLVGVLTLVSLVNINSVSALSLDSDEFKKIEEELLNINFEFEEGKNPRVEDVLNWAEYRHFYSYDNPDEYIVSKEPTEGYGCFNETYRFPAEELENYIYNTFKLDESYLTELRKGVISNLGNGTVYEYIEVEGNKYYQKKDLVCYGAGVGGIGEMLPVLKSLGNDNYMVSFIEYLEYDNEEEFKEYGIGKDEDGNSIEPVLGEDYIITDEGLYRMIYNVRQHKINYSEDRLQVLSSQNVKYKDFIEDDEESIETPEETPKEPEEIKPEEKPIENPNTGLFGGVGALVLVGSASAGLYLLMRRKNKFQQM